MLKPGHVLLLGAASLLPPAGPVRAAADDNAAQAFAPPLGPMVLTRTVWRGLHDGKAIEVTRSYAVTIRADGDGYLVDGRLIDTAVDAPAAVAVLAELERKRVETDVFPFRLDRAGRIVPGPTPAPADHRPTARAAAGLVGAAPLPAQVRQQTRAVLDEVIGAARTGTAWPADLFNPVAARGEQTREVQLPGGAIGRIAVSISVDRHGAGHVPRSFERTVTTSLGGTDSTTRETWTMGPR